MLQHVLYDRTLIGRTEVHLIFVNLLKLAPIRILSKDHAFLLFGVYTFIQLHNVYYLPFVCVLLFNAKIFFYDNFEKRFCCHLVEISKFYNHYVYCGLYMCHPCLYHMSNPNSYDSLRHLIP